MKTITLTEDQLKDKVSTIYREEQIKVLEEKWSKLSKKDKVFVVEFLKAVYPEKTHLINESKWYNTVGDIAGIFDPTGIIDIVNGISYWRQDDKLFAILSWVSAIPYLGDVIAKPVIGVMKAGGMASKGFKAAALSGDASKIAKSAKLQGGALGKFVESAPTWGSKLLSFLRTFIGKVPFLGKGMLKLIDDYIGIFVKAGKEYKTGAQAISAAEKAAGRVLTSTEKETLLKSLASTGSFRAFRDYKELNPSIWSTIRGGVPRIWGNRSVRSLMGRTKWYLGLLTFLGIGNFVGPDELESNVDNLDEKIAEYSKTTESNKLWDEEFSNTTVNQPQPSTVTPSPSTTSSQSKGGDAISTLLSLLGGDVGGIAKAIV